MIIPVPAGAQEGDGESAAQQPAEATARQQVDGQPAWLLMERAREHYEQGTYGSALRILRDVLQQDPRNANAHLWVGHVFFAEGEYPAARKKYQDALEHQDSFYPYELRFEALYSLAEIARLQGDGELFREKMNQIIEEGSRDGLGNTRMRAMKRTFLEQGPDKLLELYRMEEKRVRHAYAYSGLSAFEQGEYERAAEQLILSTCISLSLAIEAVRGQEYDYAFIQEELPVRRNVFHVENTARFLRNADKREYIREYFSSISFYRELFVLGAALYGMGRSEAAEALWLLVAEHREAGRWSNLARVQLAEPNLQAIPSVFPE